MNKFTRSCRVSREKAETSPARGHGPLFEAATPANLPTLAFHLDPAAERRESASFCSLDFLESSLPRAACEPFPFISLSIPSRGRRLLFPVRSSPRTLGDDARKRAEDHSSWLNRPRRVHLLVSPINPPVGNSAWDQFARSHFDGSLRPVGTGSISPSAGICCSRDRIRWNLYRPLFHTATLRIDFVGLFALFHSRLSLG